MTTRAATDSENNEPLEIGETEDGPTVIETIEYDARTCRCECSTEIERLEDAEGSPQYAARVLDPEVGDTCREGIFPTYAEAVMYLDELAGDDDDDDDDHDEYTAVPGYANAEIIYVGGAYQCGGCGACKDSRQAVVDHDAKVVEYGEFRVNHCCSRSVIQDSPGGLRETIAFSDLTADEARVLRIPLRDIIDAILEDHGDGWSLPDDGADLEYADGKGDAWTEAVEAEWDAVGLPQQADRKKRGFVLVDGVRVPVAVAELHDEIIVRRIEADEQAEVA